MMAIYHKRPSVRVPNHGITDYEVGTSQVYSWLVDDEIVLIDVCQTVEYEAVHIPGALLSPLSTFEAR